MHKYVFHNGRVAALPDVRLSPGQAGLLNGWGVFSTLRIYRGRPFEFDHHFDRLSRDAERITRASHLFQVVFDAAFRIRGSSDKTKPPSHRGTEI